MSTLFDKTGCTEKTAIKTIRKLRRDNKALVEALDALYREVAHFGHFDTVEGCELLDKCSNALSKAGYHA